MIEKRYKDLGTISVITEPKSYEKHGEVTGGFNDIDLKIHIQKYGYSELLETLTYMQWSVWQTVREINAEECNNNLASN